MADSLLPFDYPCFEQFKIEVSRLRSEGCRSSQAHEVVARSYGFKSYISMRTALGWTGKSTSNPDLISS